MGIPHLIVGAAGSVNGAASGAGRTVHAWSARAGYRFPREVIAGAVRWYLRYGLPYSDVEELLAGHGVTVDGVTIYRWVQTWAEARRGRASRLVLCCRGRVGVGQ